LTAKVGLSARTHPDTASAIRLIDSPLGRV